MHDQPTHSGAAVESNITCHEHPRAVFWRQLAARVNYDLDRLLAEHAQNIGERTVEREFKQHFGESLEATLLRWKVYAARDDIRRHGASNKEVILRYGFYDSSHLCSAFKKILGATPQSFAPKGGVRSEG